MTQAIIEVKNLINQFGTHRIHDGLDFELYQGEIVGIVGESGSGKSALLQSIIGLNAPYSGSVKVNGKDFTKLRSKKEIFKVRRLCGVLFQTGALFSSLTVRDNVAIPIKEFIGVSNKCANELAEMKIELVGLPSTARDKYPSELSGGMIKRAALARALALDPKILFLDEPTAGLDPISAAIFDTLIKDLTVNLNLAVFMVTHDLDSLFSICDRIGVLVDKKIKLDTLQNHLKDPHPWIREYFHGIRSRAVRKGE